MKWEHTGGYELSLDPMVGISDRMTGPLLRKVLRVLSRLQAAMLPVFVIGVTVIFVDYVFFFVDGRIRNRWAPGLLSKIDVDCRLLDLFSL